MYVLGGLEKIKVIKIDKDLLNLQYSNIHDIEDKYETYELKKEFLLIAKKMQSIPFLYEMIDTTASTTILLRSILYNPSIIPIVTTKKECDKTSCIYTQTPIVKLVLDGKYNLLSVPNESQIFVIGLAIDTKRQGALYYTLLNRTIVRKAKYVTPEYVQSFKQYDQYLADKYLVFMFNDNVKDILIELLQQIQFAIHIYQITNNFYIEEKEGIPMDNIHREYNVISWYNTDEIEIFKYLLQDSYQWIYNLYPLQALGYNLYLYLYAVHNGTNDRKILEYFENNTITKNRYIELTKIQQKQLQRTNLARRYITTINIKLGSVLYQKILYLLSYGKYLRLPGGSMAIPSILVDVNDPELVLSYLTKEQQSIITTEIKRQDKYISNYRSNTCKHLTIYFKLINSKNARTRKNMLEQFTEYKKDTIGTDGFIYCKVCNFPIICSHAYTKLEYEINNIAKAKLNDMLLTFAIKVKVNKSNEYYCKYCGEQLIKDPYSNDGVSYTKVLSNTELEIRDYTWSVIMNTLRSYTHEVYTDDRSFAMKFSAMIYPIITKKILEFNDRNKVHIVLYVYAYLLHLIKTNQIIFLDIDSKLSNSKIANELIKLIYKRYYQLLIQLGITNTYIQTEFIIAYKYILEEITVPINVKSNLEKNVAIFVFTIDSIYYYAHTIYKFIHKIHYDPNPLPAILQNEFENILGTNLKQIIKTAKLNLKNPMYSDIINKQYGSILKVNIEYFYKNNDLNLYHNLFKLSNANVILKQFLEGHYDNYYLASYVMFHKYTVEVKSDKDYTEFLQLLKEFRVIEKQLLDSLYVYRPVYQIKVVKSSQMRIPFVNITELYDENGQKHKWNIYYYDNVKVTNLHNKKGKLTDIECSICHIKKSEIYKLNIEKTWRIVDIITNIRALFMKYRNRCPLGDLHEWKDNSCIKCHITYEMIDTAILNKLNDIVVEYYNKYVNKFIQDKKDIAKTLEVDINIDKNNTDHVKHDRIKWYYNYSYIVDMAKLANVSINVIEAIGMTERRKYEDIKQGINKPEIEIQNVYSAYSELIYLMSLYSKELHKDNTLPKIKNYSILIDNLLYNKEPLKDIHKFIIQSICEIILQIPSNEIKLKLFNEIITNQKLFAEPINVDWKILQDSDNADIYLGDDIGDFGEDMIFDNIMKSRDSYISLHNSDYHNRYEDPNIVSDRD